MQTPSCFIWLWQALLCAALRALFSAGSSMLAKMAMIAMTTNNSINVKLHLTRSGEIHFIDASPFFADAQLPMPPCA
jgi:hypothetical protein